jgi:NAD+ synthase (glutamine-hydrolysing)
MFAQRARDNVACVAFCGLVGGQDELLFDGHSCVLDHTGQTIARAAQFREEMLLCEIDLDAAAAARLRDASHRPAARRGRHDVAVLPPIPDGALPPRLAGGAGPAPLAGEERSLVARRGLAPLLAPLEAEVYCALALGLRDYVRKNRFAHVVLGLSGGIDSALVACLASDALGSASVDVTIMPSPYSSAQTQGDAHALAAAIGVRAHELPIATVMGSYEGLLAEEFAGREPDITEENLQARIRGNLLMALSNKFNWLVLATGNKSEMSVGYTTLYGDLAGGFAVIKDVPKTLVYELSAWRNAIDPGVLAAHLPEDHGTPVRCPIPASIIERAPSAELRQDQRDDDSLPPYELLDRILEGYVELDRSREQLIAAGLPADAVDRTIGLVDRAEYKRRQAPPGIKITPRAFGRDRRMPITNRFGG